MIRVLVFGQLLDITGDADMQFEFVADTKKLQQVLHARFPELANRKYLIAVEKQLVNDNIPLQNGNTIALLPPFSGG
jgi:molybdopterin converting factor small subunit